MTVKITTNIIKQIRQGRHRRIGSKPYSPTPQCRLPTKVRIDTQELRKLLTKLKRK
jgi:hypothetical protein